MYAVTISMRALTEEGACHYSSSFPWMSSKFLKKRMDVSSLMCCLMKRIHGCFVFMKHMRAKKLLRHIWKHHTPKNGSKYACHMWTNRRYACQNPSLTVQTNQHQKTSQSSSYILFVGLISSVVCSISICTSRCHRWDSVWDVFYDRFCRRDSLLHIG